MYFIFFKQKMSIDSYGIAIAVLLLFIYIRLIVSKLTNQTIPLVTFKE